VSKRRRIIHPYSRSQEAAGRKKMNWEKEGMAER
jgi:hypothetical protein